MDWVHCNLCYTQPGDIEGRKFLITNCGHIYCTICTQSGKLEICNFCRTKFTSIPLNPQMNKEVESYFLDPIELLKKQSVVLEFQHNHRMRLAQFNKHKVLKYNTLKEENISLKQANASLRNEIKKCKEEIYYLKKKFLKFETGSTLNTSAKTYSPSVPASTERGSFVMSSFKENNIKCNSDTSFNLSSSFMQDFPSDKRNTSQTLPLRRPQTKTAPKNSEDCNDSTGNLIFTPPLPPKYNGSYRNDNLNSSVTSTPRKSSPITPESGKRMVQGQLQRRIKLPGDKGGPSPGTKLGFHRLTLGQPQNTSTPITKYGTPITNKYSKYF